MSTTQSIQPPQWPLRLLRFFVKEKYLEEIEGDMEEIFYENVERFSSRKANRIYIWEMIKLLRPNLIKNLEFLNNLNQYGMFKNYFKVSIRGLMKNPLNSFINVFGLAAAIGIAIFAFAYARWTYSTDQFHEHKNEVYLITFSADRDGSPQQFGRTPRPLGEMLREDFTHIKKVCRVEDRNVVMKHLDNVFHERVRCTDPDFLNMFTFPMKWGTSQSLIDANSIILSEDMSIKYFGEENPIGQDIQVIFGKDNSKVFKITGVAKKFPDARTISFDFLINFKNLKTAEPNYDFHDWNAFVDATLIQVDNPSDLSAIERGMEKYKKLQNETVQEDWALTSFAFEPLATLHEKSENIRDDISRSSGNNYKTVIFMVVLGISILVLACFNYINIAIATATKRLKEIGVRKSIGATRRIVIVQFLSENIVVTFFALIIGVVLGLTVFIRGFENMWSFSLDFKLNDPLLWMYLPAILLFTSLASGIYPSLYISKFHVVGILKGAVRFGQKNPLTKIFLCIQLTLGCIAIAVAAMFNQNASYLAKRSWGYNHEETMFAKVSDYAAYEELYALMAQDPDVLSISGSAHHLGKSNGTTVLHFPNREVEVDELSVDAKYFETMGIPIKEGRVFNDHEGSDKHSVVVNEFLAKNMFRLLSGWENPVGQRFKIDSMEYEVIGVAKDFHSYSFAKKLKPIIFTVAEKEDYRFLSLHVAKGAEHKTFKALQANWAQLFPEIPFEGSHQNDTWANFFEANKIYGIVWGVFSSIAVSLAGLGLYGLITLNVAGRIKEFSIRKVLGARIKNIIANITHQYIVLFTIAIVIGAPTAYFLNKWLFDWAFPYHKPIDFSSSAFAVMTLIAVLLITVYTQVRKVSKSNPVDGLKVE
jgi:ABC-type antimicrobial peptide transport system permease subunit